MNALARIHAILGGKEIAHRNEVATHVAAREAELGCCIGGCSTSNHNGADGCSGDESRRAHGGQTRKKVPTGGITEPRGMGGCRRKTVSLLQADPRFPKSLKIDTER